MKIQIIIAAASLVTLTMSNVGTYAQPGGQYTAFGRNGAPYTDYRDQEFGPPNARDSRFDDSSLYDPRLSGPAPGPRDYDQHAGIDYERWYRQHSQTFERWFRQNYQSRVGVPSCDWQSDRPSVPGFGYGHRDLYRSYYQERLRYVEEYRRWYEYQRRVANPRICQQPFLSQR